MTLSLLTNRFVCFSVFRIQRSSQTQEDRYSRFPTPTYKGRCYEMVPTEIRWYHLEQQSKINCIKSTYNFFKNQLLILWNTNRKIKNQEKNKTNYIPMSGWRFIYSFLCCCTNVNWNSTCALVSYPSVLFET